MYKQSLTDYTKDFIIDEIDKYEGCEVETSNLSYNLSDLLISYHEDSGSLTYDRNESKELMYNWDFDCGDFLDYSDLDINPFNNTELFVLYMVKYAMIQIFEGMRIIAALRNKGVSIVLTPEVISIIKRDVENIHIKVKF